MVLFFRFKWDKIRSIFAGKGFMMIKKAFALAAMLFFGAIGQAAAVCTLEETQAKAQAFQEAGQDLARKDQAKYQEVMTAIQNNPPQQPGDLDALCNYYDEWIKKMQ